MHVARARTRETDGWLPYICSEAIYEEISSMRTLYRGRGRNSVCTEALCRTFEEEDFIQLGREQGEREKRGLRGEAGQRLSVQRVRRPARVEETHSREAEELSTNPVVGTGRVVAFEAAMPHLDRQRARAVVAEELDEGEEQRALALAPRGVAVAGVAM